MHVTEALRYPFTLATDPNALCQGMSQEFEEILLLVGWNVAGSHSPFGREAFLFYEISQNDGRFLNSRLVKALNIALCVAFRIALCVALCVNLIADTAHHEHSLVAPP